MNSYLLHFRTRNENTTPVELDLLKIKKAALILRAINHKLRQEILMLINEHEKITVTGLYVTLKVKQSVVSQHLSVLRKTGFVNTSREGRFIYYSINSTRITEVNKFVSDFFR